MDSALTFSPVLDGHGCYIEVKATASRDGAPFYISSAELDLAQPHAGRYALYRVYDLDGEPRFFALEGDITEILGLTLTYGADHTHRARCQARLKRQKGDARLAAIEDVHPSCGDA
jgi:hypothetical protein